MGTLFVIVVELVVVLVLLRRFTGKEAMVPKTSSGVIRLATGVVCALGAYLIMTACVAKYGHLCHEELIAGSFFASVLLAVILLPLGAIQTIWMLGKRQ
jgi:hypothetical protein